MPSDQKVEEAVGIVLRIGVVLAAAIVLAGGVYYLLQYGSTAPHYRIFRGEPSDLRSLSGILRDALRVRSRGLIQFGLVILISTPVARVILSAFAFARQRDCVYVIVTLIVLSLLVFSLAGGRL